MAHFQRFSGGFELFEKHENCVGEVSVNCQLELTILGFLIFPMYKNLTSRGPVNMVAVPSCSTVSEVFGRVVNCLRNMSTALGKCLLIVKWS